MVPDSVLQSELLTSSEKLLFPSLVVLCGADGRTNADNDELAARLNISERSCSAFITNLHRAGFLTVLVDRRLKKNQRTIILNELTQDFALSPVLLQKLMLADADSCVKLAQILASALPDAKSCVMLAQFLASANKEQCADSERFTEVDAEFCVNPGQDSRFSGKKDNNIYNNILNTTQESSINTTSNFFAKNLENADLTQNPASTQQPFIWLGSEPVLASELGQLVSLRGINDDQVAPFVAEHTGRTYNDLKELQDLVRKWLRRTKPKEPKKTVAQRKLEFRDKLNEYHKLNPGKYPVDFYREFFEYWTVTNERGTVMRFEKDAYFLPSLGQKLAYAYKTIYLKNQTHATNNRTGTTKQHAFVSATDLGDTTGAENDDSTDQGSQPDEETAGHGLKTVFINLE
ncbi:MULTISPECIES: helix-turn-helix domain-containing protein [unclassified Spirosoma]|uniref:helix-turn-helix domain-containing protein n=1 Tax=unclassified Spirosoma TaxID=2621999 RepID=UPI001AC880A2|nr:MULTISPECIES: helix-turn-helix domain-containing protein [unclassified Spirosoma]MBN8824418.1 helix-turn-helix domain-containing protein [Spirosoma sp.]